jgi:hypothetical protein
LNDEACKHAHFDHVVIVCCSQHVNSATTGWLTSDYLDSHPNIKPKTDQAVSITPGRHPIDQAGLTKKEGMKQTIYKKKAKRSVEMEKKYHHYPRPIRVIHSNTKSQR